MNGSIFLLGTLLAMGHARSFDATPNASATDHRVVVTTVADSGAGSLREAILIANTECSALLPCQIVFNVPSHELTNGVATIRVATPLPSISAPYIDIDGSSQTAFGGDTNARGPEVELSGAALHAGDGLFFLTDDRCTPAFGPSASVNGIVINGFPGSAILALPAQRCAFGSPLAVRDSYLGTDATGSRAIANERGIIAGAVRVAITGNVISGNRRSGLFINDTFAGSVSDNRIGVGADGVTPLGNGASGIYIDANGGRTEILRNTIANNAEFGVAESVRSAHVLIDNNSIARNGRSGIDIGLDHLPSGFDPVLLSARYDAARDTTTVTGRLDSKLPIGICCTDGYTIALYASAALGTGGDAQGERLLGKFPELSDRRFDFTFNVNGDLSGQWISAMAIHATSIEFDTPAPRSSEFSNAVQVTR
jgi:hypothetical protein